MSPEQLSLELARSRGDAAVTPFPLARHKAKRTVRRQLPKLAVSPADLFAAARLLEDQALLDQVRQQARNQAREGGRPSKRAMFTYVCKPEGRRAARFIAQLSERIAAQEARLCG